MLPSPPFTALPSTTRQTARLDNWPQGRKDQDLSSAHTSTGRLPNKPFLKHIGQDFEKTIHQNASSANASTSLVTVDFPHEVWRRSLPRSPASQSSRQDSRKRKISRRGTGPITSRFGKVVRRSPLTTKHKPRDRLRKLQKKNSSSGAGCRTHTTHTHKSTSTIHSLRSLGRSLPRQTLAQRSQVQQCPKAQEHPAQIPGASPTKS